MYSHERCLGSIWLARHIPSEVLLSYISAAANRPSEGHRNLALRFETIRFGSITRSSL